MQRQTGHGGTAEPNYAPVYEQPRDQQEEDKPETEKGESEKKEWPPRDKAQD